MEKTYTLDQKELTMLQQVDQERMQALAMVGALSLDMEQARRNVETAQERQRSFIRQALSTRGVDRYENARTQNGALIVTVAEGLPEVLPSAPLGAQKTVNGSLEIKE